jgi:hypothetical protein
VAGPAAARAVIKAVLLAGTRLTFTPFDDDDGGGCAIAGEISLAGALAGACGTSGVAPTGFEPVFQSRPRFRQQYRYLSAADLAQSRRD